MLADRYVFIGLLGVRYSLSENRYLSLVINELLQSNEAIRDVNFSSVFGGGVKYSIKTVVRPLDIGVGYSQPLQEADLFCESGILVLNVALVVISQHFSLIRWSVTLK